MEEKLAGVVICTVIPVVKDSIANEPDVKVLIPNEDTIAVEAGLVITLLILNEILLVAGIGVEAILLKVTL